LGHLGVYDDPFSDEVFGTVAGHASAYEHEVIRQLQDVDSVSAINLLELANDDSTKIYSASTDTEWTSLQGSLSGYDATEIALIDDYIDDDFTVYLPENGNLTTNTGMGFIAKRSSGTSRARSYVISGGFGGGAATGSGDDLDPEVLLDRGDVFAGEREGTYHHDSRDMTIGAGGMPFGLSLSRTYSSQRRLEDGPLGLGWTHNFDISANVKSDSFQALGADSPIDAAAHIVALHVIHDILTLDYYGDSLTNNVIVSLVESWLMDKMMDNLVTIEQGGSKMQFVRLPDPDNTGDFYNPPTRTALKLVLNNGNFRLKNPGGVFNDFDSSGLLDEWSDAHGNKVDFTYDVSSRLDTVSCKIGGTTTSWWMTFSYDNDSRIDEVTDSADRTISYYYDDDGNLEKYRNPDLKETTYGYDAVNDGQLTEVFSPLSTVNPVLTNVYDSIGRLKQQKDADDNETDYYLAGYRAETMGPAQTPPGEASQRFSTVVWADEFGRPISATDQLGRESTHTYDGKLRLIKSTNSIGASSEYIYDEFNRVKQKDSKVKPGSSDPEIDVHFDRESEENQDGRWFIHQKSGTDPNNHVVYYTLRLRRCRLSEHGWKPDEDRISPSRGGGDRSHCGIHIRIHRPDKGEDGRRRCHYQI
jgi:YD repeat-containing protein